MRIDAHQHYWKIDRNDYGWITPEIPILYRDFFEEDLKPELEKNQIDKTILVQAAATTEETEYILTLSDKSKTIAGVVGWIDLEDSLYKERFNQFKKHNKFVGIRVMIQDMENETRILEPDFIAALSYFAELDFPVDLLVVPRQLPTVLELLKQVPLRGVIDHIGKPNIAEGIIEPWKDHMRNIAMFPNIYCKLSGMITEADKNWKQSDFLPYVNHVLEVFGVDRVMYGSDWPVCLIAATYDEVYYLLKQSLPEKLNKSELDKIFGINAMNFYKINK